MTDEFVKNKLIEWNLENLIPVFMEHRIDTFSFLRMGPDSMKEVIKAWGDREKFDYHFNNYLRNRQKRVTSNIAESSLAKRIRPDSFDKSDLNNSGFENIDVGWNMQTEFSESNATEPKDEMVIDCDPLISSFVKTESIIDSTPATSSTSLQYAVSSTDFTDSETCGLINYNENNPLYRLLNSSFRGKYYVLKTYEKTGTLNTRVLSDIIIHNEFEYQDDDEMKKKNFKITREKFIELAQSVENLFPNEKKESYYSPYYTPADAVSGPRNPRGILYDKYMDNRKKLIDIGAIKKRDISRQSQTDKSTQVASREPDGQRGRQKRMQNKNTSRILHQE